MEKYPADQQAFEQLINSEESCRSFLVHLRWPDGWSGYRGLTEKKFVHHVLKPESTEDLLPQVHLVVSLLKRWLMGTHQGGIQVSHLEYYLDEFTFRFNRRTSRSRGLLFRRILENAVQVTPLRGIDLRA